MKIISFSAKNLRWLQQLIWMATGLNVKQHEHTKGTSPPLA